MKERILEFLKRENKSSVHFAEEIGVQPSGISHILSGRNKPSLDFVLKMLEKYPFVSTEWLLFGKGSMYRENKMPTLFDDQGSGFSPDFPFQNKKFEDAVITDVKKDRDYAEIPSEKPEERAGSVRKIVWFYENNSFEEFYPRKE